ncbi:MAG TPA: terminase small subunit, partial [Planctomycetota bacterium]|nr:terminase small subunit [Planctomycetota bacterium]
DQQWKFCIEYLKCNCNGTKAAIAAGYSERSGYELGSRQLKKVEIRAAINALLENAGYTPEYVKRRFQGIAEVDSADFFPLVDGVDLPELRKSGVDTRLVKKFRVKRVPSGDYDDNGKAIYCDEYELEFHDAQRALENLAKCHRMFSEESDSETPAPSREMVRRVVIEEYEAAGDEIASGVPGIPALTLQRATGGPPRGGNGKDHHGGNGDSPHA